MKYAIGYQLPDEDDSIVAIARDFREHVAEVYFALPGAASGRSPVALDEGKLDAYAAAVMLDELGQLARMGVRLVLLVNANCYGQEAISEGLAARTRRDVAELCESFGLDCVTTTSPFVAKALKQSHPKVEVRASVNMRVGTVHAMEYLAGTFDGFYMRREHNRDLEHIGKLKAWCDANGKSLHLLANSGCLYDCAFQTFHDNLVAHESGLVGQDNVRQNYPAPCWDLMADCGNWELLLHNTWIRPEDVHNYEGLFEVAKLATRMHSRPRMVLAAYVAGRHYGNLMDLMEPSYGPLMRGYVIDNRRFPADWFERTSRCNRQCGQCDYCRRVLADVLVKVE